MDDDSSNSEGLSKVGCLNDTYSDTYFVTHALSLHV